MNKTFASLALVLLLATAGVSLPVFTGGGAAHATATPANPAAVQPAAGSGVPQGASGADVPFTNDGANRPVLETMSPDGQLIPIDPAAADSVRGLDEDVEHAADLNEGHEGAHAKKGLPQFDVTTFSKQIFWLIVVFMALYFVNSRKVLPAISSVIENRRERISSDLRAAEDLKNQVARVRGEYEAAVAEAQSQAQQVILDLQTDMKKQVEQQDADFKERSERAVEDVEDRMEAAHGRIMNNLGAIAASLTIDIAKSVAGINADEAAARRAVESLNGKKQAA